MNFIECSDCEQPVSQRSPFCSDCGAPNQFAKDGGMMRGGPNAVDRRAPVKGKLLFGNRSLRLKGIFGLGGAGIIGMAQVEFFTGMLVYGALAAEFYLLVILIRHLLATAKSSAETLRERCEEILEISAYALILALSYGFWIGVGIAELDRPGDEIESFMVLAASFSSTFVLTIIAMIPVGLIAILQALQEQVATPAIQEPAVVPRAQEEPSDRGEDVDSLEDIGSL